MGRIFCTICKKRCRGETLKVDQNYIHRECFLCSVCKSHLEGRVHCQSHGKLYCLEDYQRLYGTQCCACRALITGEAVSVFGNTYHPNCFKCQQCGVSFNSGDRAVEWEGGFLCSRCCTMRQQNQQKSPHEDLPPVTSEPEQPLHLNEGGDEITAMLSSTMIQPPAGATATFLRPPVTLQDTPSPHRSKHYHHPVSPHWLQYNVTSDSEGISSDSAFEVPGRMESPYHNGRGGYQHFYYSSSDTNSPYPRHSSVFTANSGCGQKTRRRNQSVGPPETSVSGSGSRQGTDYGRFYIQNYLQLESDHESSSTASPRNRYRRNAPLSGGVTPTPGTRSPASPHFHRPPDRPFSYRNPSQLLLPSKPKVSVFDQLQVPPRLRLKAPNGNEIANGKDSCDTKSGSASVRGHVNGDLGMPQPHPPREADCPESVEPRRLSLFPGGHVPAPNEEAAIERGDWPGPPSPAVMLMERVRQKRFPNQDASWSSERCLEPSNASDAEFQPLSEEGGLDKERSTRQVPYHVTSSTNGRRIRCDSEKTERQERALTEAACGKSGIAQALMKEMQRGEERSPSPVLDPILCSRVPAANHEPELKPRYETHTFASPSRDTRRERANLHCISSPMGYSCTGGRWTNTPSCPTTPKPGEDFRGQALHRKRYPGLHVDSSPNSRSTLPLQSTASEASILQRLQASLPTGAASGYLQWPCLREEVPGDSSSSAYDMIDHRQTHENGEASQKGHRTTTFTHSSGLRASSLATLSGRDSLTGPLSTDGDNASALLNVQNWLRPTTNSLWLYMSSYKSAPSSPKIYTYQELVEKGGELRDVDPLKREEHLSEEDFEKTFGMSRNIFKKLPQWKQMDLKRRVNLS